MKFGKRIMLGLAVILTVGAISLANTSQAKAQCGSYGGGYGGYGRTASVYHGPSVHYDRVYHPTRTHWTPYRGLHTHGHYDRVRHYVPGHYDRLHNGHLHRNRYFHH